MPDAPVPTLGKKQYEVIGPHAVHGTDPGGTVTLDLTAEQEQFYLDGGHLKIVAKQSDATKKEGGTNG